MRNLITAVALAAVLFVAGAFLVGASPARAATAPAHGVNWTEATCHAFTEWERHPSAAVLDRLVISSLHVAPKWLGGDVAQLLADIDAYGLKSPYVTDGKAAVWQDCHGGYGL